VSFFFKKLVKGLCPLSRVKTLGTNPETLFKSERLSRDNFQLENVERDV